MCEYFDKVFDLSAKLTDWSINSGIKLAPGRNVAGVTRYAASTDAKAKVESGENRDQSFLICTGGGPGFMEAANMGSASVTDARSIGVSTTPQHHHFCIAFLGLHASSGCSHAQHLLLLLLLLLL